ncbi:MAG: hypothetical protein JO186_11745 [Actinobacteria bacterium]|nr:hypothetical protein [Actinomycetota bacterium]
MDSQELHLNYTHGPDLLPTCATDGPLTPLRAGEMIDIRVVNPLRSAKRTRLLVAILTAVVVGAGLATGVLQKLNAPGDPTTDAASQSSDYELGFKCAEAAWRSAATDPAAQADPQATLEAMIGSCRMEARAFGVADTPRSAFRRGFLAGFADGPA